MLSYAVLRSLIPEHSFHPLGHVLQLSKSGKSSDALKEILHERFYTDDYSLNEYI